MNPHSNDVEELAADWILRCEAGLAPDERAAFEAWKNADPRHADSILRHERAWSLLGRPEQAGCAPAILRELRRRATRRRRRSGLAAAVALLIAGGTWTMWQHAGPRRAAERSLVITPETQTLPDGSKIELRPDAEIDLDFSPAVRHVVLRKGEALFHVAKNPLRPFVVSAGGIDVRAVGTAFDVRVDGTKTAVIVTEGRVGVGATPSRAGERTAEAILVDGGKRINISHAADGQLQLPAQAVAISDRALARQLAWREPRLQFLEMPLGEAVALMNRRSALHVTIDDPVLAALRVNGLFRDDDAEAFVRLLEANFGVRAEYGPQAVILRRARQ